MTEGEALAEANKLARLVLDGQARNYLMMRALLRVLWCVLIVTIGLFVVLLIQALR